MTECKTISAAVVPDTASKTTTIFLNVSLGWLDSWAISEIRPQMKVIEERPRLPQLVINGDTIDQFNNVTEAHILLITNDNKATYINFPWNPNQFDILLKTERWIFWSLRDELENADSFYWGYGSFDSADAFEDYISQHFATSPEQDYPELPLP